ncbi:ankyrin repeat domain-containing protein [bacterium]|jgi:ankyrin repeat protein|nr:ankyrin repeat domain-containing protein [bacterium]
MSNNHLINQNLDKHLFKNIFISLINENKWDTLIEIFSLGIVDINIKDDRGRNSLFWAIHKNKIDVIKKLISFNINTKEVSPNLSAMNYAVYQDNVKVIKCLKNCGLEINEIDDINSTPLIYAVLYNKLNSINYLVENGADINHEDFLGNSAFSLAHNLKIKFLIEKFEKIYV